MGDFRSGSRGGFRGNRSSGRSNGFSDRRGGFRDRESSFERRRPEMHKVTCDKCKKQCEVPFRPTGDKPVYCSDCFRKEEFSGASSRGNFDSSSKNISTQSGISQEQFNQINKKLDKILGILELIEFEAEDDEETDKEGLDDDSEDDEDTEDDK